MKLFRILLIACHGLLATTAWGGGDVPTSFTNQFSIINTRHNLTMQNVAGADLINPNMMEVARTQYKQVCVYCHTPHGANASIGAPLWNRVTPSATYTTYNQLGTGAQETYSQPGAASLACLSCHDGQQAVDAIINMPGSGFYNPNPDTAFLDSWLPAWIDPPHMKLPDCMGCHSKTGPVAAIMPRATDFTVFIIGTDLRNDHPVGVTYPATNGPGTDWNTPTGTKVVGGRTMKFFDETANGRLDKNEIRLYAAANGPSVECATCHDPHGVPSGAPGSSFFPSFLRKAIDGSNLCLTCHAK